mmetsp:Transcript_83279/g.178517  ORF Transcript_83279/g.178517 Transcript_83279/m.178517 type:complete len:271 (-) Transcript_83279:90-902(-)
MLADEIRRGVESPNRAPGTTVEGTKLVDGTRRGVESPTRVPGASGRGIMLVEDVRRGVGVKDGVPEAVLEGNAKRWGKGTAPACSGGLDDVTQRCGANGEPLLSAALDCLTGRADRNVITFAASEGGPSGPCELAQRETATLAGGSCAIPSTAADTGYAGITGSGSVDSSGGFTKQGVLAHDDSSVVGDELTRRTAEEFMDILGPWMPGVVLVLHGLGTAAMRSIGAKVLLRRSWSMPCQMVVMGTFPGLWNLVGDWLWSLGRSGLWIRA